MLPDFTETGDLPVGVHPATLEEVAERFGITPEQRISVTRDLTHIYALAARTGCLQRFVIFGSYITSKPGPNDVDIILIMDDAFQVAECPTELRGIFDHATAQARYGASVFWTRPGYVIGENVESFIAHWQIKRDGNQRGIIEIVAQESTIGSEVSQ